MDAQNNLDMNNQYDFNSIKGFGITVICNLVAFISLNDVSTIFAIAVGATALAINIKKLLKK